MTFDIVSYIMHSNETKGEIKMSGNKLVKELESYTLENRISQEQLSAILGVAFSTVNRWFNGKTNPSRIYSYHIRKLLTTKRRFTQ